MPISFDTTGFQQQDQNNWLHPNGDRLALSRHDSAPDLPAGLDDLPRLRHGLAVKHGETGCLIEAQIIQLGGVPALLQIAKLPLPNRPGQAFSCTVTVQGASSHAVLALYAEEHGTTGMREGVLAAEIGFERWILPHPYARQSRSLLPFHAGDDPRFDTRFPQHPLSRAREWVHRLVRSAQVDPAFMTPAPDPATFFSGQLMTAICGVPVAGYVALQIGERTTYWKLLDDDLPRRLGRGNLGRSPLGEGRFRETVMVDERTGHALLMDRFMTEGKSLGVATGLQPVTREEAHAAVTPEALKEAYRGSAG